jgi:hypothetical protein
MTFINKICHAEYKHIFLSHSIRININSGKMNMLVNLQVLTQQEPTVHKSLLAVLRNDEEVQNHRRIGR